MTPSQSCIDLIKQFEGCVLMAYADIGGILTIGYGHTGSDVVAELEISQDDALNLLSQDLDRTAEGVSQLLTIDVNQNQFDALCDFAYNLGVSALAGSTLLRKLNAGDIAGAGSEFPKWDHDRGVVVTGLLKRRLAEQTLFNS